MAAVCRGHQKLRGHKQLRGDYGNRRAMGWRHKSMESPRVSGRLRRAGLLPEQSGVVTSAEAAAAAAALVLLLRSSGKGGVEGEGARKVLGGGLSSIKNAPGVFMLGQKKWVKLGVSIVVDGIGIATFALPGIGEAGDAAWAPVSAVVVQSLYGNKFVTLVSFVEEALPFTDVIPTATIAWSLEYTPVGRFVPLLRQKSTKMDEKGKEKGME